MTTHEQQQPDLCTNQQRRFTIMDGKQPNLIDTSYLVGYNQHMEISDERIYRVLLENAASRDTVTARRKRLVEILSRERYLDRDDLIARVEMVLGKDIFGDSAWEDVFYRDMRVVKECFQAAGYDLAYSRSKGNTGYYLRGEGEFDKNIVKQIQNAVAQIDPRQVEITRDLSPGERVQQGLSITHLAHEVTDFRRDLRKNPHA